MRGGAGGAKGKVGVKNGMKQGCREQVVEGVSRRGNTLSTFFWGWARVRRGVMEVG